MRTYRIPIILLFLLLSIGSIFYAFQIKFTFDFEQFFPKGDDDLEFFNEFREKFEPDDNFLLIAFRRAEGAFDSTFLSQVDDFSYRSKNLPHIVSSQSLTKAQYFIKTPFGASSIVPIPAIHLKEPHRYEKDKKRILADERFVNNLISEDAKTLVVALKTIDNLQLEQSKALMKALKDTLSSYNFPQQAILGRAYFQSELVDMQQREIMVSTLISGVLVSFIMFLIFRRFWGIVVSLVSIGVGMLLFVGVLGIWGRELSVMAALYPVLMIIVGTSDVIHIMSKYIDELKNGALKSDAIKTTMKEIGLATLLTSTTTAIGFASLFTSKVIPIKQFGVNAAIGVMIAYITVLLFTTALLSFFKTEQIIKLDTGSEFWEKWMTWFYDITKNYPKRVWVGAGIVVLLCGIGIAMITTNYKISNTLPIGASITEEFQFFEKEFSGFRPFEYAITAQGERTIHEFEVLKEIDKLETYIKTQAAIKSTSSVTMLYKSINRAYGGNQLAAYKMPSSETKFKKYKRLIDKVPQENANILVSKDKKHARITARILDIGADTIKAVSTQIENWAAQNIDTSIIAYKGTGTGVIIDKNAEYIRDNIIWGLGSAMVIVSILMMFLFQDWRMVIISIVPNILPLFIAAGIIGFVGIELEAGVAIVFAIIFGIAVDDTIHFLSKYRICLSKGMDKEAAIKATYIETGKAICLTSIILFFGFLVMLFSVNPPSVTIGLLISATLFTALFSDLFLIPLLIRTLSTK